MNSEDVEREALQAIKVHLARKTASEMTGLSGEGAGDKHGVMSNVPTRPEFDARLSQAKAEGETQFEKLRGDIRELKASTAGKATIIITAIALFAAITAVLIGLSLLGWQGFGMGLSAHDMAVSAAREAIAHPSGH